MSSPSSRPTLGFGIVGVGMIADYHAQAIAHSVGGRLVGIATRNADNARAFAAKHQVPFATSSVAELVAGIAGERCDAEGRNFLLVLAANRRLGLLPQIIEIYEQLRSEVENTLDVQVTTAYAFNDAQRSRLSAALSRRFGREVRLHETVDTGLVGGAVVRAGDMVIDGSLKGRLEQLAAQIAG